jgi:hypothetical protein
MATVSHGRRVRKGQNSETIRADVAARGAIPMAETHGHEDPNAAPMHHDIVERFGDGAVAFCYLLAFIALVAGVVAGLALVE